MNGGILSAFSGRVGQDAEQRFTREGKPFVTFSLAVDTGKTAEDPPTWVRCVRFSDDAPELAGRLLKGEKAYVEGALTLSSWTGQDAVERHGLNVIARLVQPLNQVGRQWSQPTG